MPAPRETAARSKRSDHGWDAFQGDGAGQADVLVDALLGLGTTGPQESRLLKPLNG